MIEANRYRYDVVQASGRIQAFSGIFKTKDAAISWYDKNGEFWINLGKNLVTTIINQRTKYFRQDN